MRPVVCAYYVDDVPGFADPELLGLWRESWWRAGWDPQVVNRTEAREHPRHAELLAARNLLAGHAGTLCGYIFDCYERWLAYAVAAAGSETWLLSSDWDVVNYGFGPDDLRDLMADRGPGLVSLGGGPTPCLVYGYKSGYEAVVDLFLEYEALPFAPDSH